MLFKFTITNIFVDLDICSYNQPYYSVAPKWSVTTLLLFLNLTIASKHPQNAMYNHLFLVNYFEFNVYYLAYLVLEFPWKSYHLKIQKHIKYYIRTWQSTGIASSYHQGPHHKIYRRRKLINGK